MKAEMTYSKAGVPFTEQIEFSGSETDLFKKVGQKLPEMELANSVKITVEGDSGVCTFDVKQRGSYVDDKGAVMPQLHICPLQNTLSLKPSLYSEKVYTCIHPQSNNYKAYGIVPINSGNKTIALEARYESIDKYFAGNYRTVKDQYGPWTYWLLHFEKLSKGYKEQTRIVTSSKKEVKKAAGDKKNDNSANAILYRLLMDYAHQTVQQNIAAPQLITPEMVKKSWKIWEVMSERKTVNGFNRQLQELMCICPRKRDWKADKIKDQLATSKADFDTIIRREESLIRAMDAVCGGVTDKSYTSAESFKQYDIHIWEATDTQKQEVMSYLTPNLQSKVKKIYRVKPSAQEKKFSSYCKKNRIKEIKKLWHGSTNPNWASIIRTSLSLGHGTANGRMFGDGLYFAPSAPKSFNYTSCKGTTWARGSSDTGFMGLYATAYGKPWLVSSSGHYTQSQVHANGYDCIHAESARTGLRADEIIYYDCDAICINYLVEFAA